jgi:hypothetical protein
MLDQEIRQTIVDEEHLKLLSIGYYISAALNAAFSLFGLLHMAFGMLMFMAIRSSSTISQAGEPPPQFVGLIFVGIGLAMFVLMITAFILKLMVASRIRKRKARMFCMAVAGIGCIEVPYGTLLGILTFMVLERNSVQKLFESAEDSPLDQPKA